MKLTLEIYKTDARTKSGERFLSKMDLDVKSPKTAVELHYKSVYPAPKYRVEIHETFVTRKSMMGGAEFQERYDTPYYCSPSSETFWSS